MLKKTSIKNKIEWIGFLDNITRKEEVIIIIDTTKNIKIVKIKIQKIYLYLASTSKRFFI